MKFLKNKVPPNFRVHTEFQEYTKPVVVVPEPEETSLDEEPINELLIDISNNSLFPPVEESPFANESFQQIQNYIIEIDNLKAEIERIRMEHEFEIRGLRERIKTLENELLSCKSELEQQKIVNLKIYKYFIIIIHKENFTFIKKNQCLEEQIRITSENEKAKEDLELLESNIYSIPI